MGRVENHPLYTMDAATQLSVSSDNSEKVTMETTAAYEFGRIFLSSATLGLFCYLRHLSQIDASIMRRSEALFGGLSLNL